MPRQQDVRETTINQKSTVVSFEVSEVISLLCAFEGRITAPDTAPDETYDPFAPGFPGVN